MDSRDQTPVNENSPRNSTPAKSIELNYAVADQIDETTAESGRTTTIAFFIGFIILVAMMFYSRWTLVSSGGVYEVESSEAEIQSSTIIDQQHYFDDRVAMVQSAAARHLTELLNQTGTSFEFINDVFLKTSTENGKRDILANLKHYGILKLMYDPVVVQMNCRFDQGAPLVIEPHYPNYVSEEDKLNPETRNSLPVDYWTLEVKSTITYGTITQRERERLKVLFTIDILPISDDYRMDTLVLDRMSLWEVLR